MELPVKERVRKRKAIDNLYLDDTYQESSDEGLLFKLRVTKNLSDFKEGEYVILHKEGMTSGQPCQICSFDADDNIIISVYALDKKIDSTWYKIPLILDKNAVDLRDAVYYNYVFRSGIQDCDVEESFINTLARPQFADEDSNSEELDDTIKNFGFSLTPKQREAILHSMSTDTYYLLQGPPGTGKSFVLAIIILEEVLFFKRKVAVVGPNHMAINNALIQVLEKAELPILKIGQSYYAIEPTEVDEKCKNGVANVPRVNIYYCNGEKNDTFYVYGFTPHAKYTSRAKGLEYDTLVIDEAGQLTIPLAMMAMKDAKKIILASDHKQLPPIISTDRIPTKLQDSIFKRLIQPYNCTMLDISFRMCGPICEFVSTLFYDSKLKPHNTTIGNRLVCGDKLYSYDKPIVLYHVSDEGEQTSDKEAEQIAQMIIRYINEFHIGANDIAVLSPFRAQVANIRKTIRKTKNLSETDKRNIKVDTVDKMQGQEREVIIFSMASGKLSYMKEMGEFLYNPNKLNVAFSRAKYKLIIVGNLNTMRLLDRADYPHIYKMLSYSSAIQLNL